jgi:hypothetical protein
MKLALMLMLISFQAFSQEVQISGGVLGGSFYEVPKDYDLNKYGKERLSPSGLSFKATLESDKFGKAYFRKISVNSDSWGEKKALGSQTLLLYDSPKFMINDESKFKVFLKGAVSHFDQKDHLLYFKVDKDLTPVLDSEIDIEPKGKFSQNQTYFEADAGICYDFGTTWKDFELAGFIEASVSPLGLLNYKTKVDTESLDKLNKQGTTLGFGGEIQMEGVAKYKDHYYFKLKFVQSYNQGINSDKVSATNRMTIYELGYLISKNFSVNLNVENNELTLSNKDRRSIEVYNIVGLGLKYSLPEKKKKITKN